MYYALNSFYITELRWKIYGSERVLLQLKNIVKDAAEQKLESNMDPWFDRELFRQVVYIWFRRLGNYRETVDKLFSSDCEVYLFWSNRT